MSLASLLYNNVFRRTSTTTLVVIAVAFVYERGIEELSDYFWQKTNKGKLWKDVKHLYVKE